MEKAKLKIEREHALKIIKNHPEAWTLPANELQKRFSLKQGKDIKSEIFCHWKKEFFFFDGQIYFPVISVEKDNIGRATGGSSLDIKNVGRTEGGKPTGVMKKFIENKIVRLPFKFIDVVKNKNGKEEMITCFGKDNYDGFVDEFVKELNEILYQIALDKINEITKEKLSVAGHEII